MRRIDWAPIRRVTVGYAVILLFLASVVILLTMYGCMSTPKVEALADADSWVIPVEAVKLVEPAAAATATRTDGEATNIEKAEEPELIIMVPPSDKPTKVEVRKVKQQHLLERVMTNKPAHEIKSDNQGVTAAQPKKAIWWRWLLLIVLVLFFVCALIMAIANRVANWSPAGMLKNLLTRWRK